MIRRLNESRKDEVLKMTDTYRKYITRCKNLLDHIERDWDDFAAYLETTNGTNQYYDDIDSNIYELSKAFTGLNYLQVAIRNVLGKPVEKVWESRNYKRRKSIRENRQRDYYDPELDQFEIYLMTNGTNGHDEIRDYVNSRRNTGVFGSFGSEYGSVSVYVNTDNIDDDFVNEVEDLIIFAQEHGARLNVPCYNELKDLFTVKHVAHDI